MPKIIIVVRAAMVVLRFGVLVLVVKTVSSRSHHAVVPGLPERSHVG